MSEPPLPSGVVTFLMTDVEDSTRLWDAEPEAMALALADHDRLIEEIVSEHEGRLIKSRGEGDSTFSVFVRPSAAVRAAATTQAALGAVTWPTSRALRVRMALHTGDAGATEDGDYLGSVVNRAARLRGLCTPGGVLVSSACAAVVADDIPAPLALRPLGAVHLRGLARDDELFALVGPGLAEPDRVSAPETTLLDERGVTPRERDVLGAIADRLTNAEIAEQFCVSERTVESHVSSLLRKLEMPNRIELSDLAKQLSAGEGTLELPPMLAMAAQRSACVGRGPERLALLDCWRRASNGQTGLAVVTGEAGIGKSRLVADLAGEVHDRGGMVLMGAATDGAGRPFQPIADALEGPVVATPEHRLRDDLGRSAADLARIVPAIADRLGLAPSTASTTEDHASIGSGIQGYLTRVSQRRPVLLVLEDLHWAGASTRELVLDIARRARQAPLLVLVTTRDVAPDLDESLTRWLASVERIPVTTMFRLEGLDLNATCELLADLELDADPDAALQATGGNPLFLREFSTVGSTGATMREFVAERLGRLSAEDLVVVHTAAAIGESFTVDVVATATGRAPAAVLECLDRCGAAGLTQPVSDASTRYVFLHALVRDACYDSLGAGRRLQLHQAIATALRDDPDQGRVLPELARHAAIAAPLGDADAAADWCERAGRRAILVGDLAEAARHFERALDIVDLADDSEDRRLRVSIRLGEALTLSETARSREILREAIRLARRRGDAQAFADAVCAMTAWGGSITPSRRDESWVALAEEALAMLPDDHSIWRIRVLALLGSHLALAADLERGKEMARKAVAAARDLDDDELFIRAALSLRFALDDYDFAEIARVMTEAHDLATTSELSAMTEMTGLIVAHRKVMAGDVDGGRRLLQQTWDLTDARGINSYLMSISLAVISGRLDEAHRLTAEMGAVIPEELGILYVGGAELIVGFARRTIDTSMLEILVDSEGFVGSTARAALAFARLIEGRRSEAETLLDEERRRGEQTTTFSTGATGLWAEVASVLGDRRAARELLALLDPLAGRLGYAGPMIAWVAIDLWRGMLLLALDRQQEAADTLDHAVAQSRSRGTTLSLGRELVCLAQARLATGASPQDVAPLVDEALAIAEKTGVRLFEFDVETRTPELRWPTGS